MSTVKIIGETLPNIPWQEKPADAAGPVWRHSGNPVIDRNPAKGIARIFNSAVVPYEGRFVGVFRAETINDRPHLHLGWSEEATAGRSTRSAFLSRMRTASRFSRDMPMIRGW